MFSTPLPQREAFSPNYINFGLRPDSNMAAVEDEVDDHFNDIDIESLLSRAQRRPLTFNRKKSVYIGKSCAFHSAFSRVCVSWHVCLLLHGAKLSSAVLFTLLSVHRPSIPIPEFCLYA